LGDGSHKVEVKNSILKFGIIVGKVGDRGGVERPREYLEFEPAGYWT